MIQRIRLFPFIIGIVLGTIAMFFIKPQQNVTYKYPTPETSGKVVYKDKNGVCCWFCFPVKFPLFFPCFLGSICNSCINEIRHTNINYLF